MTVTPLPKAVNASDIAPERLAANPALTEQQKIAEASRQFEAMLLRQILDSTQKPVITSKFTDNSTAAGIYRDLITTQLADSISKSGTLGLANTFEQQLTRRAAAPVSATSAASLDSAGAARQELHLKAITSKEGPRPRHSAATMHKAIEPVS